ncbi:MAG TPA: HNH endonuclease [Pyrinomonadaceae bacterium]|jgi:hypothetical protein
MGAELRRAQSGEVQRAERDLEALNSELKLDLAQAAIDVAGIADPTPISDVVGAGLSLFRGDFVGAGLSLISAVPYAGDALGKTAKGARLAKKINDLKRRIEAGVAAVNLLRRTASPAARRAAAATVRARRSASNRVIHGCTRDFNTRLPADGKGAWGGQKGNSRWTPDPAVYPNGRPVTYRNGYPDFSPHARQTVRIEMSPTGNRAADFRAADAEVRRQLNDPNWRKPDNMTWHHHEDGTTMQLVPRDIHQPAQHTGGVDIVTDPGY